MQRWATIFFCVAVVAGLIGFGGVRSQSKEIAQIACYIFMVAFLVTVVANFLRGGTPK